MRVTMSLRGDFTRLSLEKDLNLDSEGVQFYLFSFVSVKTFGTFFFFFFLLIRQTWWSQSEATGSDNQLVRYKEVS